MKSSVLTACAVLLSACSGPPSISGGPDPADPSRPVPAVRYVPVLAGTVDYAPVAPRSWIEQNQDVAPAQGRR